MCGLETFPGPYVRPVSVYIRLVLVRLAGCVEDVLHRERKGGRERDQALSSRIFHHAAVSFITPPYPSSRGRIFHDAAGPVSPEDRLVGGVEDVLHRERKGGRERDWACLA